MAGHPTGTFIGVDWGTSSFRLWMMAGAKVLSTLRSGEGMLHCGSSGFRPVLERHLAEIEAPGDLPVLICGMAGARQGWVEVPYVHTPAALDDLHKRAVAVPGQDRDIRILPGLAQVQPDMPDVMRGEETQLLGSIDGRFSGLVCMPGTHCKWVTLERGRVIRFSTYMTGELYAVLSRHSTLGFAMEEDAATSFEEPEFQAGLARGRGDGAKALGALFSIRAGHLLGFRTKAEGAARLSGLLIGAEIAAAEAHHGASPDILLIGAGRLSGLYEASLALAGHRVRTIDAEQAVCAGLAKAAAGIWRDGAAK